MFGAIIGDIVGSSWEFNPTNDYNFPPFSDENSFTDDTICTVAVAETLLHGSQTIMASSFINGAVNTHIRWVVMAGVFRNG